MPRPKPTKSHKTAKSPKRPSVVEAAPKTPTNAIVWANLVALMIDKYGEENQTALARDAKTSPGNIARIKLQQTSVGFKLLETIASAFDGVQPWQLLVPGLDPKHLPVVRVVTNGDRKLVENIKRASDALVDFIEQANTRPGGL